MKIVAISDTHGHTPDLPDGDILIIAGDIFPIDNHDHHFQRRYLNARIIPWIKEHNFKHVLFVPGNHDFLCEIPGIYRVFENQGIHFLVDRSQTIEGINFYGFPWVPNLEYWAFHAHDPMMVDKCDEIPMDTDILISHGPPINILDNKDMNYGCTHLAARLQRVLPMYHIFGHVHEGYGEIQLGDICFMNVSYLDDDYQIVDNREIQVFDYTKIVN